MIRGGIGVAVSLALGTVPNDEASAQVYVTPAVAPENPPVLSQCLPFLDWNPALRGSLLIVAPERAKLQGQVALHLSDVPPRAKRVAVGASQVIAGRNGFSLATISPRYRRKLVTVGGLSTVVPETMGVLRYKDLPEPNLLQVASPENRPHLLLATLSESQWARLMSPDGLGINDLKRNQQPLFAGLFPETIRLQRTDPPAPGQGEGKAEETALDTLNLSTVRLRLHKELSWSYIDKKGSGMTGMGTHFAPGDRKEPIYRLLHAYPADVYRPYDERSDSEDVRNISVFGANLLEAQPNRAKPSDIDYSAAVWNASVSLGSARTVDDLVSRICEATRVEIYADTRYAELAVYTRSAESAGVRAGDLLKALALSVTGTYRRLESGSDTVFVMTNDRVGSGVRLTLLNEWIEGAHAKLRAEQEKLTTAAQEIKAAESTPWLSEEDKGFSAILLQKRMARKKPSTPVEGLGDLLTPLADLPPGVQARVRSQLNHYREMTADQEGTNTNPLRQDGVLINEKDTLAAVIPGIGTIALPHHEIPLVANNANPVPFRSIIGTTAAPIRQICRPPFRCGSNPLGSISVCSHSALRARTTLAKPPAWRRTATSTPCFFPSPINPSRRVAGWLAAAREVAPDMPMWLRASVFRGKGANGADDLDRTILGETYAQSFRRGTYSDEPIRSFPRSTEVDTGDYVAVGDGGALPAIRSRLVSLTRITPEPAGIVLTDTMPLGYGQQPNREAIRPDQELGYHPAARVAFVRETGTDPVDLSPYGELDTPHPTSSRNQTPTRVRIPYFPDLGPGVQRGQIIDGKPATELGAKDVYPRWYGFRAKRLSAVLASLHGALKGEGVKQELLVQSPGTWDSLTPWEPARAPVTLTKSAFRAEPAPPPAFLWLPFAYSDKAPAGAAPMKRSERFARQIALSVSWMGKPLPKEAKATMGSTRYGLLLDLTQAPLVDVDELLSQIVIEF
jgi:hypothetical protein